MRIMKVVERILFGVNGLLWGIFAVDILLTCSEGRCCHCFDFEECRLEMAVYGLTAAWLVAGGIVGRGILGRWGKWTCAVERLARVALARPDGRMAMARRDGGL